MQIQKVMIVGAGTMGHALAQTFAVGGFWVSCVDVDRAAIERALRLIKAGLATLETQGILEKGASKAALERIRTFVGFDEIPRDIDLVIEAIYEDEHAKKELFERIDQLLPLKTIIASNTSYLNVFELAKIRRPERFIITHWFTPPHIIPIVEVVRGPQTSSDTVRQIMSLLEKLGKKPILVERYLPGFVVNRLQRVIGKEIFSLIDNGIISPQDLDTAAKYTLGIRIPVVGVVQRYDYAGLDFSVMTQKNEFISKEFNETPSKTLEALVKAGHLGVKSGKGFYDYGGKAQEEILRDRDIRLLKVKDLIDQFDLL
ncbi:MAG: 3-hydroxyacyl-CoA dehydrogenase NAD-binding domain-containing protein [Pseudomonadota bacterium]